MPTYINLPRLPVCLQLASGKTDLTEEFTTLLSSIDGGTSNTNKLKYKIITKLPDTPFVNRHTVFDSLCEDEDFSAQADIERLAEVLEFSSDNSGAMFGQFDLENFTINTIGPSIPYLFALRIPKTLEDSMVELHNLVCTMCLSVGPKDRGIFEVLRLLIEEEILDTVMRNVTNTKYRPLPVHNVGVAAHWLIKTATSFNNVNLIAKLKDVLFEGTNIPPTPLDVGYPNMRLVTSPISGVLIDSEVKTTIALIDKVATETLYVRNNEVRYAALEALTAARDTIIDLPTGDVEAECKILYTALSSVYPA